MQSERLPDPGGGFFVFFRAGSRVDVRRQRASVLIARLMKVGGSWGVSQRWCDCVTYCRSDHKASGKRSWSFTMRQLKSMFFCFSFCFFLLFFLHFCVFKTQNLLFLVSKSCFLLCYITEVSLLPHNKTWQTVSMCCLDFSSRYNCFDDQFNQLAVFFKQEFSVCGFFTVKICLFSLTISIFIYYY